MRYIRPIIALTLAACGSNAPTLADTSNLQPDPPVTTDAGVLYNEGGAKKGDPSLGDGGFTPEAALDTGSPVVVDAGADAVSQNDAAAETSADSGNTLADTGTAPDAGMEAAVDAGACVPDETTSALPPAATHACNTDSDCCSGGVCLGAAWNSGGTNYTGKFCYQLCTCPSVSVSQLTCTSASCNNTCYYNQWASNGIMPGSQGICGRLF